MGTLPETVIIKGLLERKAAVAFKQAIEQVDRQRQDNYTGIIIKCI